MANDHSNGHVPMKRRLMVGCSGFAAAHATYFRALPAVEVQQTFYQPPKESTLERWRAGAPPGFTFSVKAWQLITHEASSPTYRRLRTALSEREKKGCGSFKSTEEVVKGWQATLSACKRLRSPVVLFQTPARFDPSETHLSNLKRFFESIDRSGLKLVWEPRGRTWKPDLVRRLCRDLELTHGVDPFVGPPAHAPFLYYRLHGMGGYRHRFTETELEQLIRKLPRAAEGFIFFNNISMWDDARTMVRMLSARS